MSSSLQCTSLQELGERQAALGLGAVGVVGADRQRHLTNDGSKQVSTRSCIGEGFTRQRTPNASGQQSSLLEEPESSWLAPNFPCG